MTATAPIGSSTRSLHEQHAGHGDEARDKTNHDGCPRGDESAGRRHGDQSGQHAVHIIESLPLEHDQAVTIPPIAPAAAARFRRPAT